MIVLRRIVRVQQRVPTQIFRRAKWVPSLQQARAANRKHLLAHQAVDTQTRILAGAVTQPDVDALAHQVHETIGCVYANVDLRVQLPEAFQARQ